MQKDLLKGRLAQLNQKELMIKQESEFEEKEARMEQKVELLTQSLNEKEIAFNLKESQIKKDAEDLM